MPFEGFYVAPDLVWLFIAVVYSCIPSVVFVASEQRPLLALPHWGFALHTPPSTLYTLPCIVPPQHRTSSYCDFSHVYFLLLCLCIFLLREFLLLSTAHISLFRVYPPAV